MITQIGYIALFWIGFAIAIAALVVVIRKDYGKNPDAVEVHRTGKDAGLVAAFGVVLSVASPYSPAWWEIVALLITLGAALAVAWRKEKEEQAVQ